MRAEGPKERPTAVLSVQLSARYVQIRKTAKIRNTCTCCFALFVCLTLLASFFLPSHLSFKNMYILGLVFGVIGGFITPAFSFILS